MTAGMKHMVRNAVELTYDEVVRECSKLNIIHNALWVYMLITAEVCCMRCSEFVEAACIGVRYSQIFYDYF